LARPWYFFRIFESGAVRAARSHLKQNPGNQKKFQNIRRIFVSAPTISHFVQPRAGFTSPTSSRTEAACSKNSVGPLDRSCIA
jgi:hypothetical protein